MLHNLVDTFERKEDLKSVILTMSLCRVASPSLAAADSGASLLCYLLSILPLRRWFCHYFWLGFGYWPRNVGVVWLQGCGMMRSFSYRFARMKLNAGWIASRICQGRSIYVWSVEGGAKEIHVFQQNFVCAFPLAGVIQAWFCPLFIFILMLRYVEIYLVSRFGFVSLSGGFLGRDMLNCGQKSNVDGKGGKCWSS